MCYGSVVYSVFSVLMASFVSRFIRQIFYVLGFKYNDDSSP